MRTADHTTITAALSIRDDLAVEIGGVPASKKATRAVNSDRRRRNRLWPKDALAVVRQAAPSPGQGGILRKKRPWTLTFEPRERSWPDFLMGWYGSGDTLQQVSLSFPTKAAALDYARRQGLDVLVLDAPATRKGRRSEPESVFDGSGEPPMPVAA